VCSDNNDALVDTLQGLRLQSQEPDVPTVSSSGTSDSARLECQLQAFLGRQPAQDDLRCTVYLLANVAAQLAGGNPISSDAMLDHATKSFPFGMENATQCMHRHMVQHGPTHPNDSELVGMVELVADSDDDLLAEDSLLGSDTRSCTGSHHPSLECFVTGTPEGYVEDAEDSSRHSRDRTPPPDPAPVQADRHQVPPPAPAPA